MSARMSNTTREGIEPASVPMGAHAMVANRSARADGQDAARDGSAKCARLPYQRDGSGALDILREACLHAPDVCLGPLPAGRRARARIVHPPAVPSSSSCARSASDTVPFGRSTVTVPLTTPGAETRGARPLVWSQPCGPPTCGPPPDGRTTNCADDSSSSRACSAATMSDRLTPRIPNTLVRSRSCRISAARASGATSQTILESHPVIFDSTVNLCARARLAHWLLGCHASRRSD